MKALIAILAAAILITVAVICFGGKGATDVTVTSTVTSNEATDDRTDGSDAGGASAPAYTEPYIPYVPAATPGPADTQIPGAPFKVGIALPSSGLKRWVDDGGRMERMFEALGYQVDLEYGGDNEVAIQVSQIENMIAGGCDALIIAAIDGGALSDALAVAKVRNIPVIAYDRLIMNSDAVSYYLTFNNNEAGTALGSYIRDKLNLDTTGGPYNIEIFAGSPDDSNDFLFFFRPAMAVLKPYMDSGKITVKSGQTRIGDCATRDWSAEEARKRMENLISQCGYGPNGTRLDAVLSLNDSVAQGVSEALKNAGYTADNFPIITGQDCDKASVINMRSGMQAMSVFRDTNRLAAAAVMMVQQIRHGQTVAVNDTKTYDNSIGNGNPPNFIPTFLCDPDVYTIQNINKLVGSGYYTWGDIGGPPGALPLDGRIGR